MQENIRVVLNKFKDFYGSSFLSLLIKEVMCVRNSNKLMTKRLLDRKRRVKLWTLSLSNIPLVKCQNLFLRNMQ